MSRELKLLAVLLLFGTGLILGLKFLFPLVAPFLLGLILACLIEPVVKRIELKLRIARGPAVGMVLFTFVMVILGITCATLFSSFREAQRLLPKAALLVDRLAEISSGFIEQLSQGMQINVHYFSLNTGSINRMIISFIGWVLGLLPRLPEIILAIVLGGVTAYFFSRDKELFSRIFYRCLPQNWRVETVQIKDEIISKISNFLRAEFLLCFITTGLTVLFFGFLRFPGAVAYGLLAGMLDLIPVIGPGLVFIPFASIQFIMGDHYQGIVIIIGFILILGIRQICELKLIGNSIDLHPLITIALIYMGIKIFGFGGILFGPILIITLRALYRALAIRFAIKSF